MLGKPVKKCLVDKVRVGNTLNSEETLDETKSSTEKSELVKKTFYLILFILISIQITFETRCAEHKRVIHEGVKYHCKQCDQYAKLVGSLARNVK